MTREALFKRFDGIRTWKKEGLEAPHKGLVLMMALAKVQAGTRWLSFATVNEPLKKLIERFGKDRASYGVEDPFWRLKNDRGRFWEVRKVPPDRLRNIAPPSEEELLDFGAEAGFTEEVYNTLSQNPRWIVDLAKKIYGDHQVGDSPEEVFRAVGLLTSIPQTQ
jgi:putative restriction endonuclease